MNTLDSSFHPVGLVIPPTKSKSEFKRKVEAAKRRSRKRLQKKMAASAPLANALFGRAHKAWFYYDRELSSVWDSLLNLLFRIPFMPDSFHSGTLIMVPDGSSNGFPATYAFLLFSLFVKLLARQIKRLQARDDYRQKLVRLGNPNAKRVVKRLSLNPPPKKDVLLHLWNERKNSTEAALRFGSALLDLEASVDNSLERDESGAIVGRRKGVKGFLKQHCEEIYLHYCAAMRYRRMAIKLRAASGLAEPVPGDWALPSSDLDLPKAESVWEQTLKHATTQSVAFAHDGGKYLDKYFPNRKFIFAKSVAEARERARKIFERTGQTLQSMETALDLALGYLVETTAE